MSVVKAWGWVVLGCFCAAAGYGSESDVAAARAYNQMGFQLLAQCRESLPKPNYFLSPPGLAFALAMLENGAQGETLDQIQGVLQSGKTPLPQLNQANKALLEQLTHADPKITLQIANAIWIDSKASIKPDFLAVNESDYDAEVSNGNFQDPATVGKINDWVSGRTHGKIPTVIEPPLDPMLRMILLDAIYFKGDWQDQFDTNLTRDLPFTLAGGQTIRRPRMSRSGRYNYYENGQFQCVELPYAGGDLGMVVFLPKASLGKFLNAFTEEDFHSAVWQMMSRKGTVELPRFKLENEYDLTGALPRMGMSLAFTDRADFRGISDEPLSVGFVKQKTYVAVNEQGTVAAAVTSIGIRAMVVRKEEPPFRFVVDRPFFLAIRERQTGLILFLGAVSDPR